MAKDIYPSIQEFLVSSGLTMKEAKRSLFGVTFLVSYPLGEKEVTITLNYSSLSHSVLAEFLIPYGPAEGPLMEAYDRIFPQEKNMWGRSTPAFPKAIENFKRCKNPYGDIVELREGKTLLYLRLARQGDARGEKGMLQALKRISEELRGGEIHRTVLIHMFAF